MGAAELRARVISAWLADPRRVREDANHEQDLRFDSYQGRVVVELLANAADAAVETGSGRVRVGLAETDGGWVLAVANTGARFEDAGLAALASLRTSDKGDEHTGHFGVGFASVLAVSDTPVIAGRNDAGRFAVRFDAERSRGELVDAGLPSDRVPVLRLPFVAPLPNADLLRLVDDYDTVVWLPLRDAVAVAAVRDELDQLDDTLRLVWPQLVEVVIATPEDERSLPDPRGRWKTWIRNGFHSESALADRPGDERSAWWLTWALPLAGQRFSPTVHAPTPSSEPLAWPAALLARVPIEPGRRHLAAGAATDEVIAAAADAYVEMLAEQADLALLPSGPVTGWFDAALRAALFDKLGGARWLTGVDGARLSPAGAQQLAQPYGDDPHVLEVLAPLVGGLVRVPPDAAELLARLGVTVVELADIWDAWSPGHHPDSEGENERRWAEQVAAIAALADDPVARESLRAMPVPLLGGGLRRGVAGVALPPPGVDEEGLAELADFGIAVLAPGAATEAVCALLQRLGANPGEPSELLDLIDGLLAGGAAEQVSTAVTRVVLDLLEASSPSQRWQNLADLPVPDQEDDEVDAALLVLPGTEMADLLDPDDFGQVHPEWATRWSAEAWQRLGVPATGPVLMPLGDLDLDPADVSRLYPDETDYAAQLDALTVRDLDLVRADRLADFLQLTQQNSETASVFDPVAGTHSYLARYLRAEYALTATRPLNAAADPVFAALPESPGWVAELTERSRAGLGLPETAAELTCPAWRVLLRAPAPLPILLRRWRLLAETDLVGDPGNEPGLADLMALDPHDQPTLVPSTDIVVCDNPAWAQRRDLGARLIVPSSAAMTIADLLDLDLASDRADGLVAGNGSCEVVAPEVVSAFGLASEWVRHEQLLVDGKRVSWWVSADGRAHAETLTGAAKGLARNAGRWPERHAIAAALNDPSSLPALLIDEAG